MAKLKTLKTLTPRRGALLLAAFITLAGASLILKKVHFKRIAAWLGKRRYQESVAAHLDLANDIGWAVRAAARRVPFRALCFEQALAAAFIASSLRVPTTLYLGVANAADGSLEAHAWLRIQACILTGARGHERFRVVATFAPPTAGESLTANDSADLRGNANASSG